MGDGVSHAQGTSFACVGGMTNLFITLLLFENELRKSGDLLLTHVNVFWIIHGQETLPSMAHPK